TISIIATGDAVVGGVAGASQGAVSNVASSVIVTAGGSGHVNAGGIVGASQGTVSNVYTTGAVSATTSGTDPDHVNAGGIVGTATGAVSNVYATGAISATSTANNNEVYAGGIAGTATASGAVSYAYATGAITATGATGGGTNQNGNPFTVGAGGIAGAATGTTVRYTVALNSSVTAIGTSYNRCSFRITSTSGGEVTGGPNYGSTGLTPSVSGSGTSHTGDPGATEQGGVDVTVATGTPYTAPDQTWWTDMGFLGANWTTVWEWDGATTGLPKLR
ncbi:MAG: hypothetical protein LBT39_01030, partial [Treponema sp.]|nr:hypothetical protein [Treponema sp.]